MATAMQTTMMRLGKLYAWLEKVNARRLWDAKTKGGPELTMYQVNGRPLLLWVSYDPAVSNIPDGWDLYAPVCDSNETAATLNAAAERCGSDVRVS